MIHKIKFKDKPEDNHDVLIGSDLLHTIPQYIRDNISKKKQAVITDKNVVDAGYLEKLDPKGEIPVFIIEPDANGSVEVKKNVKTYGEIIDFLDSNGFEKNDVLICLGGGVIGDIGGFAAGTYKRTGMKYVQVPLTTIAQADSCLGGKCAVDSNISKNAAGCIYQPSLIVIDVSTLSSLDDRNFRSGLIESIKYGLTLDKDYFTFLEENIDAILDKDTHMLEEIAYKNVCLKGNVIEKDPKDENYRISLNFGHTIGHGVEIVSEFKLNHGESVALGILSALKISQSLNGFKDLERVQELFSKLGMPAKVPSYIDRDMVEKRLVNDKKAVDGIPYFVTIDEIGKLHVSDGKYAAPIPKEALKEGLDYVFN